MASLTGVAADIFSYKDMTLFADAYDFIAFFTPNDTPKEWNKVQPLGASFEQICLKWVKILEPQFLSPTPLGDNKIVSTVHISTDASDTSVGGTFYHQKDTGKYRLLGTFSRNLPPSLIAKFAGSKFVVGSTPREIFGLTEGLKLVQSTIKSRFNLKDFAITLHTDSTGAAFNLGKSWSIDPRRAKLLQDFSRIKEKLGVPVSTQWHFRSVANQQLADLFSRLQRVYLTKNIKGQIGRFLKIQVPVHYPFSPLDFVPFKFNTCRAATGQNATVIIPPFLPKKEIIKIAEFLWNYWEGTLLLILPFFQNFALFHHTMHFPFVWNERNIFAEGKIQRYSDRRLVAISRQ